LQNYSSVNKRQATLKKRVHRSLHRNTKFYKAFYEASALMNILGERWYIDILIETACFYIFSYTRYRRFSPLCIRLRGN